MTFKNFFWFSHPPNEQTAFLKSFEKKISKREFCPLCSVKKLKVFFFKQKTKFQVKTKLVTFEQTSGGLRVW